MKRVFLRKIYVVLTREIHASAAKCELSYNASDNNKSETIKERMNIQR
jgi:hypothetical protein